MARGLTGEKLLQAVGLLGGQDLRGFRAGKRRLGALQLDLEGRRVDLVEDIPLLHEAALLEGPLDHEAGDARAHLRDPQGRHPARQVADIGDRLLANRHDADFGERTGDRCRRLLLLVTGREGDQNETGREGGGPGPERAEGK